MIQHQKQPMKTAVDDDWDENELTKTVETNNNDDWADNERAPKRTNYSKGGKKFLSVNQKEMNEILNFRFQRTWRLSWRKRRWWWWWRQATS